MTKLGKAVKNWVQEFSADLPTSQMIGRKTLQDPEIDRKKEVGDVGCKSEPGLG